MVTIYVQKTPGLLCIFRNVTERQNLNKLPKHLEIRFVIKKKKHTECMCRQAIKSIEYTLKIYLRYRKYTKLQ